MRKTDPILESSYVTPAQSYLADRPTRGGCVHPCACTSTGGACRDPEGVLVFMLGFGSEINLRLFLRSLLTRRLLHSLEQSSLTPAARCILQSA